MQNATKNLSKNNKARIIIKCLGDLRNLFDNDTIQTFSTAREILDKKIKSFGLSYSDLFNNFSFNNKPEDDRFQKMQDIYAQLDKLHILTDNLDTDLRYTGNALINRASSAFNYNNEPGGRIDLFKKIQALITAQINTPDQRETEEDIKEYPPVVYENIQTTVQRLCWEVMAATILGALFCAVGFAPYLLLPYVLPPVISVALVLVGTLSLAYGVNLGFALCFDEEMVYNKRKQPIINDQADTTKSGTSNNRSWFCCC